MISYFAGSLAPFLNYINTATFPSERTKYMSIGYGFQCLGMTIGPLIQAALSPLQGSEPSTESYISFDMFTAAGYYFITIDIKQKTIRTTILIYQNGP